MRVAGPFLRSPRGAFTDLGHTHLTIAARRVAEEDPRSSPYLSLGRAAADEGRWALAAAYARLWVRQTQGPGPHRGEEEIRRFLETAPARPQAADHYRAWEELCGDIAGLMYGLVLRQPTLVNGQRPDLAVLGPKGRQVDRNRVAWAERIIEIKADPHDLGAAISRPRTVKPFERQTELYLPFCGTLEFWIVQEPNPSYQVLYEVFDNVVFLGRVELWDFLWGRREWMLLSRLRALGGETPTHRLDFVRRDGPFPLSGRFMTSATVHKILQRAVEERRQIAVVYAGLGGSRNFVVDPYGILRLGKTRILVGNLATEGQQKGTACLRVGRMVNASLLGPSAVESPSNLPAFVRQLYGLLPDEPLTLAAITQAQIALYETG